MVKLMTWDAFKGLDMSMNFWQGSPTNPWRIIRKQITPWTAAPRHFHWRKRCTLTSPMITRWLPSTVPWVFSTVNLCIPQNLSMIGNGFPLELYRSLDECQLRDSGAQSATGRMDSRAKRKANPERKSMSGSLSTMFCSRCHFVVAITMAFASWMILW